MQQQSAVKTAREAVNAGAGGIRGEQIQLDAPRFFVQFGWEALHTDTQAVPNRYFLRGEITPIRSHQVKTNIYEIPEGAKISGSEENDRDGKQVYAKYWCYAHYEAERLISDENNATYKNGIVEIKALGAAPTLYDEVDFNALLFPGGILTLPEKNADVIAALRDRVAHLEATPSEGFPEHLRTVVLNVGREMIAAAELAQSVQHGRLQYTHSCMKLKPGDEGFKREYDAVDREMIRRTGVPEIHAAEIQTATALNILSEKAMAPQSDQMALLAILAEMKAQGERQFAMMEMLMAERKGRNEQPSQKR